MELAYYEYAQLKSYENKSGWGTRALPSCGD